MSPKKKVMGLLGSPLSVYRLSMSNKVGKRREQKEGLKNNDMKSTFQCCVIKIHWEAKRF